ncbi:9307_t:CDS:2, partial [Gigaspora rosea]
HLQYIKSEENAVKNALRDIINELRSKDKRMNTLDFLIVIFLDLDINTFSRIIIEISIKQQEMEKKIDSGNNKNRTTEESKNINRQISNNRI